MATKDLSNTTRGADLLSPPLHQAEDRASGTIIFYFGPRELNCLWHQKTGREHQYFQCPRTSWHSTAIILQDDVFCFKSYSNVQFEIHNKGGIADRGVN